MRCEFGISTAGHPLDRPLGPQRCRQKRDDDHDEAEFKEAIEHHSIVAGNRPRDKPAQPVSIELLDTTGVMVTGRQRRSHSMPLPIARLGRLVPGTTR